MLVRMSALQRKVAIAAVSRPRDAVRRRRIPVSAGTFCRHHGRKVPKSAETLF
jgi:hypothetical protein